MTALPKLPEYRSHKVVQATKIGAAEFNEDGSGRVMVEGVLEPLAVPPGFQRPDTHVQEGDYLVIYEDGYLSWSPKAVFEAGYHELEPPPEPVPPPPPKEVAPLLMSKVNPEGWKLEELLDKTAHEIATLKTPLIRDDPRIVAKAVVHNNDRICALLHEAARLQRDSYRMLATIGPNEGPLGKPRIGTGS